MGSFRRIRKPWSGILEVAHLGNYLQRRLINIYISGGEHWYWQT